VIYLPGIVGRISPATWIAVETFLTSIGSGQYYAMAKALVQMGATDTSVDISSFARDLEKIFTAVQVFPLKKMICPCARAVFTTFREPLLSTF